MTARAETLWWLASVGVALGIVALWQVAADRQWVSPIFLPGPDRAWATLREGFGPGGDLALHLTTTLEHMLYGWVIASATGILLGALIGSSRHARAWLGPTLEYLRPLPASAIAPVAIAFLGLSQGMVLAVIAFGSLWPTLLATAHGVAAVEPRLIEVARALRLTRLQTAFKIALPNAMPDILAALRYGLTVALILAVVGEMLAGQEGLGQRIVLAARAFRSADLFAGVILLGLIGFLSNTALAVAERRLLRWRAR